MKFNEIRTRDDAIVYINEAPTDAERDRRKMMAYALLYRTLMNEHPTDTGPRRSRVATQE